jgi:uncharacterized protein (DUF2252 family)
MATRAVHPQTGAGLSFDERRELGRSLRKVAPRSSHAEWEPSPTRADPLRLLAAQDADRVESLVPIRHLRMSESAFAFYRGTAAIMAADLAATPASGLATQICGDAHLSNFGMFASPERDLLFDVNDFDETLAGPWEWDLKRLAASLVLAARDLGLRAKAARAAASAASERYQQAMRRFSRMGTLELWYEHGSVREIGKAIGDSKYHKRFERNVRKARRRTSLRSFHKLAEVVDGRPRLRSDPPLLVPLRDLDPGASPQLWEQRVRTSFEGYHSTLSDEMLVLLGRYEVADIALKVVGVGSVGTRCFAVLLIGRDVSDPLLLQIKEAGPSVLEGQLGGSPYENSGHRVVEGQRLMQAFGDSFLGWSRGPEGGRDFYWRQLKDMKGSAEIEAMDERLLSIYAAVCGMTLARAHARGGDAVAIAAYLGRSDTFARAVTAFAERYADRAEADYRDFAEAVESGAMASHPPAASPVQR